MEITNIAYFIEIIVAVIAIVVGLIIYGVKHKKGFWKFLCLSLLVLIIAIGTTFVLEKPKMEIKGNKEANMAEKMQVKEIVIEANSTQEIEKPKTTYHYKDVTENVRINGNIDYKKIGEYKIKFELDTLTGVYSEDAVVKIVDTKAPTITLEGDEQFKLSYSKEYEEPGYKAIDEYEGDLTDKVKANKQEIDASRFDIKYEVEDSSGNKAEKIRNVNIIDDVPPVLTLNGSSNITVYLNNQYEEKGAKAQDEVEGDLTDKISKTGTVDTSKEGTYTITYKVADSKGNEATKERKVVVMKKPEPTVAQAQAQNGTSGSQQGVIYLTFDDGPSTNITPKVLDILKEKNVKATFFILNYNSSGEKLVQREYAEGHTVAIHGYSHEYSDIYKSEEAYMANITKLQEKIKASIGYNATITRFPGGSSNTISKFNPGIMTRLTKLVLERGYRYFDWNVSSGDAGGTSTSEGVYNNVVSGLSKSKQNVVLMHDFGSNTKLLGALGDIIDYGLANGYTFSRITENTPMVTHRVNN